MGIRSIAWLMAAFNLGLAQAVSAAEPSAWKFGGFGTIGASYQGAQGLEYRRSADQKRGTRADRLSTEMDSTLGSQLSVRASSQIDGMVQAVSRQYADGGWDPRLTWAFVRYAPNDDWQLRAGRLGLDTQIYADSRAIGYSYLTVRPGPESFGTVPFDSLDGLDLRYQRPLTDNDLLSLKLFHGSLKGEVATADEPARFGVIRATGLVATLTHDDLQMRLVHVRTRVQGNGDAQSLVDALRMTGFASAYAAADKIDSVGRKTNATEVAVLYDGHPWSVEASMLKTAAPKDWSGAGRSTSYGVLAGYRSGSFKPYLGFARMTISSAPVASGLPPFGPLLVLDQAVQSISAGSEKRQQTWTAGVRYDFAENMDLKFQVDGVRAKRSPLVTETQGMSDRYRGMFLFSAALDFVF